MVPLELVRDELAKLLQSKTFANTERLRRFLRFVVEIAMCGRAAELKEYLVGVEVFDRGESFDPRSDSVVRVEAHSLRIRLERYYAGEGMKDPVVIELPKGGYAPGFRLRSETMAVRPMPATFRHRRWLMAAAGASVLFAVAALSWGVYSMKPSGVSLAVLPFRNLSGDRETHFIAEGLVDELSMALARVRGLRLTGRLSTARFEPEHLDLDTIRRSLRVAWLLEGSVRRADERLRVAVRLVRVRDGEVAWSETYAESAGELFQVQERMAAQIVAALGPYWNARAAPSAARPPNSAAYDAYLRGRYWRRQMSAEGITRSIPFFEEAIQRDAGYAPAYAALADAYAMMAFHGLAPFDAMVPKARGAARRSLELDSGNARAHGAVGWIAFTCDRDPRMAEREFRQAIGIDPNWPSVREWYAFSLVAEGRFDEATAQCRQALELEPLSFLTGNDLSTVLYFARRYPESIASAGRALAVDARATAAHIPLGASLTALGRLEEGIAEFRRALDPENPWSDPMLAGRLGNACARAGRQAEARMLLVGLAGKGDGATAAAYIYAGLGERDEALRMLAEACAQREGEALFMKVEPLLDPLRSDPRFSAMIKRLGY
jgi:TolB-like protein/Flp pilus assembly protein TadD